MGQATHMRLTNAIWSKVTTDIKRYGDLIDILMAHMTTDQLQDVLRQIDDSNEKDAAIYG